MIALLARLRRAQRGAAIVEFALVLVPLVLFLFGGLDLGYQAYLRSVVQGALNDVARSSSLEAEIGEVGKPPRGRDPDARL